MRRPVFLAEAKNIDESIVLRIQVTSLMEDRSQLLIAATEAFAQTGHSHASSHMYEELALQHLSSVSAASRLKVAHLLCPISHAPEAVMKALANDHDQMIGEYVALNSKSKVTPLHPATPADEAQDDLVDLFLERAPISSFADLKESLTDPDASTDVIGPLSEEECFELCLRGLKYGHTSMVGQLAHACRLTPDQVHQCCTHTNPDGFIVMLVGLGFSSRMLDQLLVRFWGTLVDTDRMRDLQKAAIGVNKKLARQLISSWSGAVGQPRYHSIFEATETVVRELKAQGTSLTRPSHYHAELATLKA
ncbi:hypothetical protein PSE_2450 [Pseudovibrio sp. FO-BEG1]|nr:hypothetical protein PSE_2450 [Pseudovibrio sp. FO-BEG1]